MRRLIPILCQPRFPGAKKDVRLFVMNEQQSEVFEAVAVALCSKSRMNLEQAGAETEKLVTLLLAGKPVPENAEAWLLKLRRVFPVLGKKQIRGLKRSGCPSHRPEGFILTIEREGHARRNLVVRFDEEQREIYAELIGELMDRDGHSRDEAWLAANSFVSRILCGAEIKDAWSEPIVGRLEALFPALTQEELLELPEATEDDVLKLSFTHLPPQAGGRDG